ncbi:uncharacterized protein BJ171DRAFT_307793 [Polychytrium aggregatum]|uniref:uncharacterized protein n=1 Tax=Polychytrium aggregatum TaxID=110093 RepID=UPI0022FE0E1A|nr:uncharacterized protein BJ171DRAFT_307793 [Polychytrium aggregatum]KAI9206862.1 hypothetical protein BJ171DRAFT_307793 [Polychytrium aggregatum]
MAFETLVIESNNISLSVPQPSGERQLWSRLWGAGLILADLVPLVVPSAQSHPGSSDSVQRVIELGSGLALPSLVAARLGAHVTMTDASAESLALAELNAKSNSIQVYPSNPGDPASDKPAGECVCTRKLNWYDPLEAELASTYDLVLGSDIMYMNRLLRPVARQVRHLLKSDGKALLVDAGRCFGEDFLEICEEYGLKVSLIEQANVRASGFVLKKAVVMLVGFDDDTRQRITDKLRSMSAPSADPEQFGYCL